MRRYIREAKISYIQLEQETQLQDHTSILWQPPLLAQPGRGPDNEAIHWALLSLLISSSILILNTIFPLD